LKADVARCERWLVTSKRLAVSINSVDETGSLATRSTLAVRLAGDRLEVHWHKGGSARVGPVDWYYLADRKGLKGFDLLRHERLVSPQGLGSLIDILPQEARLLLVRGAFGQLMDPLVGLNGWKAMGGGTWRRNIVSDCRVTFARGTGALAEFRLVAKGRLIDWQYRYGSAPMPSVAGSSAWPEVSAFLQPSPLPTYTDPGATSVARRAIRAYDGFGDLHFLVEGDGMGEVWRIGGRVGARDGSGAWTYDGKRISVRTQGRSYAGAIRAANVAAELSKLGMGIDPLALALLRHENFAGLLFRSGLAARSIGAVGSGSDAYDLLEIVDGGSTTQVAVDRSGWIRRLSTRAVGSDGQVLSRSERIYTRETGPAPKLEVAANPAKLP
jgi:hypothetical protein